MCRRLVGGNAIHLIARDQPVANGDDSMRSFGDPLFVRDDDDRSSLRRELVEDREDLVRRLRVEVSGRFVRED